MHSYYQSSESLWPTRASQTKWKKSMPLSRLQRDEIASPEPWLHRQQTLEPRFRWIPYLSFP